MKTTNKLSFIACIAMLAFVSFAAGYYLAAMQMSELVAELSK